MASQEADKQMDTPPPYSPPPAGSPYVQQPYPPQPYPPPTSSQQQYAQYPQGPVYYTSYPSSGSSARTQQVIITQTTQPQSSTVVVRPTGDCPNCRSGYIVEQFTCCGLMWAIFFFPLGIICCLLMKRRMCSNCGYMVL